MRAAKLFFFGTPRVERDDQPIQMRRRKGIALLAYLTISGRPHSREALATLLWPEFDQSRALSNLRREMSRLKQDTGIDLFLSDRKQLAINPDLEMWVDVDRFKTLMGIVEVHDHFPEQQCDKCLDALNEATRLAVDDFMAGFTLPDSPDFDEWQFFQGESLRQSLSKALQMLMGWHSSRSELGVGVSYARRWTSLEPLHEPAHRALMNLYAQDGQMAAALRQYEECVRLLDEELGIEPERATHELYEAIRTRQIPRAHAQPAQSGDDALASGKYLEAQVWFQDRLKQAQAADDNEELALAWRGMGRASLGMNHLEMAHHHFLEALRQVQAAGDKGLALIILADIVAVHEASGKRTQAVELAQFVAAHPLTGKASRAEVEGVIGEAISFPSHRLAELREKARQRRVWPTVAELVQEISSTISPAPLPAAPRLPVPTTPIIGRKRELSDMHRLLIDESDNRLLTLIGPAGIGKTRLALEAADQSRPAFPDGTFFIPLAPITSPDQIVSAIADGIGFQLFESTGRMQQILDYLNQKELLLLIDNFEHVVEGAIAMVEILQAAPAVRIIATSREALNVSGETIYPVRGLSVPTAEELAAADVSQYGAMELFLHQARRIRPGLEPDAEELRHVARIVRLVWGMPLAVVMAAGWLEILSVAEIADEIADNLSFLESTARDLPERQRSMRAAFDYSWQRLSRPERQAFMNLSIFGGSFNRQAAQAVAGAGLRSLRTLVSKSFLSVNEQGRFAMHTLLRQYGMEHLEEAGEQNQVRAAHSDYFLNALRQREEDLTGKRQLQALEEIEADLKNISAAWQWAVQMEREELLSDSYWSLHLAFHVTGRYHEGAQLLRPAWRRFSPNPDSQPNRLWRCVVPCLAYSASYSGGVTPEMKRDVELCLMLAGNDEDRFQEANCLLALSCYALFVQQDPGVAIPLLQRCLTLYRGLERHFSVALTLAWLGWAHGQNGEPDLFRSLCQESLEIAEATGNLVVASAAKHNLGFAAITAGDYVAAERYCRQTLAMASELGLLRLQSMALARLHLGLVCFLQGKVGQARSWADKGLQIGEQINVDVTKSYAYSILSLCASVSEDGLLARKMSERSRLPTAVYYFRILSDWARAVSHSTVEDDLLSWESLRVALRRARDANLAAVITWLIPVAAILLKRAGQLEPAAELLALAFHHPRSALGWMGQWSLLNDLSEYLRQELGETCYNRARERGKEIDLEAAVTRLLSGATE